MERLKKLIEEIEKDHSKVLCFYGFNDGRKRAERLYICYESNINLYSKLLPYEPLLGKLVKAGKLTWEQIEKTIKDNRDNHIEKLITVRLIHGEYPSLGMDTDHGAQVVGFDSLEEFLMDVWSLDRGEIGHCLLANPESQHFDHHSILTKEQMFKDALKFCQDKKEWKFLFEWGDNVEEKCNQYTPAPPKFPKLKDDQYVNLITQRRLIKQILELDPNDAEMKEKLPKIEEELKEYEE